MDVEQFLIGERLVNALLRVTLHIVLNPWSQLCCDVTGLWLSAFS